MVDLKMYDKNLIVKKKLDGSTDIVRKSQLYTHKEYIVLSIKNQYIGGGLFILNKLQSMDSRRFNILDNVKKKNDAIKFRKSDNRIHRDVAEFITNGEKIII